MTLLWLRPTAPTAGLPGHLCRDCPDCAPKQPERFVGVIKADATPVDIPILGCFIVGQESAPEGLANFFMQIVAVDPVRLVDAETGKIIDFAQAITMADIATKAASGQCALFSVDDVTIVAVDA